VYQRLSIRPGRRDRAGSAAPAPGRRRAVSGAALLVLLVLLGAALFAAVRAPKDDVAWLLYVADQWLDGGRRPYADLVEINPPPAVWISVPPAALARALGLPSLAVAPPVFAASVLGCAWWAACVLRDRGLLARGGRLPGFAAIGAALLVLPAGEFGQREHLIAAAALPYLALRTRAAPAPAPGARRGWRRRAEEVLAGALAGLCCALKPWYALAFALVEAAAVLGGGARLMRGAALGAAAAGLASVAATLLFHPAYLGQAVPLAAAVYGAGNPGLAALAGASAPLLFCLAVAWLLWSVRGPTGVADGGRVVRILLTFATGATLAYLLQGKGWYYQRIPATLAAALALLAWAAAATRAWLARAAAPTRARLAGGGPAARPAAAAWSAAAAAAALLALTWAPVTHFGRHVTAAAAPARTPDARLAALIRAEGARSYVAFSRELRLGFPVVNETGVLWASRFASTWALYGEHLRASAGRTGPGAPAEAAMAAARRMAEDVLAVCPDLVAVDDRDGLDYPGLLGAADARFAAAWSRYEPVAAFDGLRVFRRPGAMAPGGCAAGPAANAG
jgi:hypothetical protein